MKLGKQHFKFEENVVKSAVNHFICLVKQVDDLRKIKDAIKQYNQDNKNKLQSNKLYNDKKQFNKLYTKFITDFRAVGTSGLIIPNREYNLKFVENIQGDNIFKGINLPMNNLRVINKLIHRGQLLKEYSATYVNNLYYDLYDLGDSINLKKGINNYYCKECQKLQKYMDKSLNAYQDEIRLLTNQAY